MRIFRSFFCFLSLLLGSAAASAQSVSDAKQPFVEGLIQVLTGINGAFGDERAAVTAGLARAEGGLRTWDDAIAGYRAAVTEQLRGAAPQAAARLHIALGAVYLDRGRAEDAIVEFGQAATLDPARAEGYRFRALAHESAGNIAAAASDFAKAWTLDRRDPAAAYLFLFYKPSGESRPPDAQAVASLEAFAGQPGGGTAAPAAPFVKLSLLEERQSTEPVFLPALYADAGRQLRRRRYDAALASFQRAWKDDAINKDAAATSATFRTGAAALREGRWKDAIERLESAGRELPSSAERHRMLGTAFWLDDQIDKAVAAFRAAIAANPRDERSRVALADLYMATRNPADAERVLREATAVMPDSGQAYWRLGRALELLHRDADARQARERAIAIGAISGESRALNAVVREYRNENDLDKAVAASRARVAADLNDSAAHDQLGQVFLQAGQDADALVELVVARLLDPSRADPQSRLAQVYLGSGRYSEAIDAATRALALDPKNREARFALGRALQQTGRSEDAARELAAAERLQLEELEKTKEVMATNLVRTEALLREQQGKWDEAAALRREVTTHVAAQPSDFTLLGEALAKAGRHADAIEAFREALGRDSQPEIFQGLIREFTATGRTADADVARTAYERVKRQRFLESVQGQ